MNFGGFGLVWNAQNTYNYTKTDSKKMHYYTINNSYPNIVIDLGSHVDEYLEYSFDISNSIIRKVPSY